MKIDPRTGLVSFDSREEYRGLVAACPPPTPDDCTVLVDGRRVDTPAKARAYMAEVLELLRSGHARDGLVGLDG